MTAFRSQQQDLRRPATLASTGIRYVLIVRAPGIGLNILDTDRWTVMESRSTRAEIDALFQRARSFVDDRGQVAVVTQRLVGREVETRIVERHRATGAIAPSEFARLDHLSQQAFWSSVDRSVKEAKARTATVHDFVRPAPVPVTAQAHDWSWWRPVVGNSVWIAGFSACCALLTWPPAFGVLAFVYEAFGRKYGF